MQIHTHKINCTRQGENEKKNLFTGTTKWDQCNDNKLDISEKEIKHLYIINNSKYMS